MRVKIQPEFQIQRINQLQDRISKYREWTDKQLHTLPSEKSWSIMEVIEHMMIAQNVYEEKITKKLNSREGKLVEASGISVSGVPSFLIKKFAPKEDKIRMKMKTSKIFDPRVNYHGDDTEKTFQEFDACLEKLKSWIELYRKEPISLKKFNSAIGAVVRFNAAEACEFILAHNERHFFQIDKIAEVVKAM